MGSFYEAPRRGEKRSSGVTLLGSGPAAGLRGPRRGPSTSASFSFLPCEAVVTSLTGWLRGLRDRSCTARRPAVPGAQDLTGRQPGRLETRKGGASATRLGSAQGPGAASGTPGSRRGSNASIHRRKGGTGGGHKQGSAARREDKEMMPFAATRTDRESITVSEVRQRKTNTIPLPRSLKAAIQRNLYTKQKQTHRRRKQT